VETTPTTKAKQSKMQPLEVKPQIKVVEYAIKTTNSEVGTKPLVVVQVETIETIVEQQEA
jgi:hypothetical protein